MFWSLTCYPLIQQIGCRFQLLGSYLDSLITGTDTYLCHLKPMDALTSTVIGERMELVFRYHT